jgi:hypothetical protein
VVADDPVAQRRPAGARGRLIRLTPGRKAFCVGALAYGARVSGGAGSGGAESGRGVHGPIPGTRRTRRRVRPGGGPIPGTAVAVLVVGAASAVGWVVLRAGRHHPRHPPTRPSQAKRPTPRDEDGRRNHTASSGGRLSFATDAPWSRLNCPTSPREGITPPGHLARA